MYVKLTWTHISSFFTPACEQTRVTRGVACPASATRSEFYVEAVFLRGKNSSIHFASKRAAFVWSWSDRGRMRRYLNAIFLNFLILYFCDICFQNCDKDWVFFVVLHLPGLVILWARRRRKAGKAHGAKKALASRSQRISPKGVVNWTHRSRFFDIGWERQPCP